MNEPAAGPATVVGGAVVGGAVVGGAVVGTAVVGGAVVGAAVVDGAVVGVGDVPCVTVVGLAEISTAARSQRNAVGATSAMEAGTPAVVPPLPFWTQ